MMIFDDERRVRARLRRARGFLAAAWFVHGTTLVIAALAVVTGVVRPLPLALAVVVFAAVPLGALIRWERTEPSARRPAGWVRRAVGVALPHQVGFGLAAATLWERQVPVGLAWLVFAAVPMSVELTAVALASRAMRRPLTADLGRMEVEVLAKIRSSDSRIPAMFSNDDVVITDKALVITVRPDLTWKFVETIDLADIAEIDVRPATAGERWLVTEDGRVYATPPGNVVRVVHRSGVRSIPVEDPSGFASVLGARIDVFREAAA
ncbi:hypothetical protein [Pseudonocardia adelaidensis]|uniref:Uncharacterized protein n=1 Tax=Pseudonocardia adelaidensis TaxID=648754 RepID=A0ABP9NP18_9PSEU